MEEAKVHEIVCHKCSGRLVLENPKEVPSHISTICPLCETKIERDLTEADVTNGELPR